MSGKVSYGPLDFDFKEKSVTYRIDPSKQLFLHPAEPLSYIILQEDGLVKAKNGLTGKIDFSGTDAASVIQQALNALTPNRTWKEKVVLKGDFSLTVPLNVPAYTILDIQGRLQAKGINAIQININGTSYVPFVDILNGIIDGVDASGGTGISSKGHYCNFVNLDIRNFYVGLSLGWTSAYSCGDNLISRVNCHNNRYEGVLIQSNDNMINFLTSYQNETGLRLNGQGGLLASNVHLWGNTDNGLSITSSINDYFLNLESENNANYGILIGSGVGNVTNEKFVNVWVWGNGGATNKGVGLGAASPYSVNDVVFIGGKIDKALEKWNYVNRVFIRNVDLKDCTVISGFASGEIRYCKGYVTENSGTVTFSGNGTQTQFTIAHGLAGTPTSVSVTPASNDAKGTFYVTVDATNIYVNYATAPPAGTNNVVLYWSASM